MHPATLRYANGYIVEEGRNEMKKKVLYIYISAQTGEIITVCKEGFIINLKQGDTKSALPSSF
jgi:hypothetical protein